MQSLPSKSQAEYFGVVDGMPIDDYHRHPALSNSGLGELLKSPAHYREHCKRPRRPTDSMDFGNAVHAGILEPKRFYETYVPRPEGLEIRTGKGELAKNPWATTEGKQILAELSQDGKKIVLPAEEYRRIDAVIHAVYSHPLASAYLSGGKPEQSVFAEDPETGVRTRVRPDYLHADYALDVKTTEDSVEPRAFQRWADRYGAFRQAAFGLDVLDAAGHSAPEWVILAVETGAAPHGIRIYFPDVAAIEFERNRYRPALRRLEECERTGLWPGYPEEPAVLFHPAVRQ